MEIKVDFKANFGLKQPILIPYTLESFADLASAMREAGIDVHFTVGGHFPSMRRVRFWRPCHKLTRLYALRENLLRLSFSRRLISQIPGLQGTPPGPLRRTRSPKNVVSEIRHLYQHDRVQFFIFQDDDFAAKSNKQRQ